MYCAFRDRNPTPFLKYRKILSLVSGNFRWAYLPIDYNSWPDLIVWTSCEGRKSSFGSILLSPVRWIASWTNIRNRTFARVSVVSEWGFWASLHQYFFQASPLTSMRTESLAESQSCRSIDADAWCKRALTVVVYEKIFGRIHRQPIHLTQNQK